MVDLDERKRLILDALTTEIHRQAGTDLNEIDLVALAVAIDRALGGDGRMPGEPDRGTSDPGRRVTEPPSTRSTSAREQAIPSSRAPGMP